ncbi:MAG TPA: outer membrane beta-barrel protein [Elusimicrobiales bacterium]|nr:outer membrane beta-barrel protein [Elusimicrobiales bacterium]
MKEFIIPAILLLAASNAAATGNLKFGNLEINPFISTQESYDSNIYLEMEGKNSSMINRTSLGVDLAHKLGSRVDLSGGYTLELLSYDESPTTNNAAHSLADIGVKVRLPGKMTLSVTDKYAETTDQATTQETDRAERVQNNVTARFEAPIRGKFGFALEAGHTYHNYLDPANAPLDREELLSGADITFQLMPKTKTMVSYRYGDLNYSRNTGKGDATYNNIEAGLVGNIAPKLTGTLKAGVQMRNYAENNAGVDKDIDTFGYSAQLLWKAVPRTEIVLYAKRANVETSYGDSRFYTTTLTDLAFSREVRKVKLTLGGSYETIEYAENTAGLTRPREDDNITARLLAEYSIQKWLKADLGYNYKARLSNDSDANNVEFGYRNTVITASLKAMF